MIRFLPHPSSPARRGSTSLLNTLALPKSFTLGNVQMHLTLLSLDQDFPLLRREDLKPGRLGLYSQTSARPKGGARDYLRNRIAIVYAPRARCDRRHLNKKIKKVFFYLVLSSI